jgi:type IV secretion system protein VirB5
MAAEHKSAVYKDTETPNPFRDGQDKAYADILMDKMKKTSRWRLTAYGSLALFAISLMLFNLAVKRQQTVSVLINVMPSGETQYLGEVRQSQTETPEAAVIYQVRKFITNLRSVSTDYQVVYNNIDECYAMITSAYEPVMTRALRASPPFDLVGKTRRSLEIESIIKVTAGTYQVDWTETSSEGSAQRAYARPYQRETPARVK